MRVRSLHPWKVSSKEAVEIQERFRRRLKFAPLQKTIRTVAGADVSYSKGSPDLFAAVVVMSVPDLEIIETRTVKQKAFFPYIPGLLSFRELPPLCRAFEKLDTVPDAVLCDAQGIAHPRGFGLASHLGVLLDLPSVGCAKTRLVGEFKPVAKRRWSRAEMRHDGKVVGMVLRTRAGVKPVFVSPGHRIGLEDSVALVRRCTDRFRLPEPTRQAHLLVNRRRREAEER